MSASGEEIVLTTLGSIDFDSPWKEALEEYLADFLALFFPDVHKAIDWQRAYTFLDSELQQVTRDAELGRRLADKLVQVYLLSGADVWVLVHIEVQSQEEQAFAKRMFVYYYRLFDRFDRQIASLAKVDPAVRISVTFDAGGRMSATTQI